MSVEQIAQTALTAVRVEAISLASDVEKLRAKLALLEIANTELADAWREVRQERDDAVRRVENQARVIEKLRQDAHTREVEQVSKASDDLDAWTRIAAALWGHPDMQESDRAAKSADILMAEREKRKVRYAAEHASCGKLPALLQTAFDRAADMIEAMRIAGQDVYADSPMGAWSEAMVELSAVAMDVFPELRTGVEPKP